MSREIMQQALNVIKDATQQIEAEWIYDYEDGREAIAALEAELAKPEQDEPSLPPVFIGVDVTPEGTHVTAFYRKPDAVPEMFYSEFHPLAKTEQEPVAWRNDGFLSYEAQLKEKIHGRSARACCVAKLRASYGVLRVRAS